LEEHANEPPPGQRALGVGGKIVEGATGRRGERARKQLSNQRAIRGERRGGGGRTGGRGEDSLRGRERKRGFRWKALAEASEAWRKAGTGVL